MGTRKNAPPRRTKLDISRLTIDQVKSQLVALGIRPTEFVQYVEALHASPPHGRGIKLQPHERLRFEDHDALNHDPFLSENAPLFVPTPAEQAFHTWHWQLYNHELEVHIEGLTVSAMRTLLSEAKDEEKASRPARQWGREDFARFAGYLLANRDQREFEKAHAKATMKKVKPNATKQKSTLQRSCPERQRKPARA